MSRPKRLLNPRVLRSPSLSSKLRTFYNLQISKEYSRSEDGTERALDKAGLTKVDIVTLYTIFTAEAKHDTVPQVRIRESVPLLREMFEGATGYDTLCRVGTDLDPTQQRIDFSYIVDSIIELPKKGVRQKRSEKEKEFKAMHVAAFCFARDVYTMHKELTKKQLKDFIKGTMAFCKAEWGQTIGRAVKRKRSTSFSVKDWLRTKIKDTSNRELTPQSEEILKQIHNRADEQLSALHIV